jgi:mutator protein MutT
MCRIVFSGGESLMGMSNYYQEIRNKVGSDLILMPSVAGIIRNEAREILFQNKGNGEKWSLPAGAIELGEAPAEAVVREVWEETGLHVVPKRLLGVYGGKEFRYEYPNGHKVEYVVFVFECIPVGGEHNPIDSETAELRYFSTEDMPELALPYPESIFSVTDREKTDFQWDEGWVEKLQRQGK